MSKSATTLIFAAALAGTALSAEQRPPSIILIMADDLGYEGLSINGGAPYVTPRLDRMANEGTRFMHCHSAPLCTPSRVQIMTGKSNHRNYTAFDILDPSQRTFGNMLRDGGYRTAVAGKWQLGGDQSAPRHFGFDNHCLWQHTLRRPNLSSRYRKPTLEIDGEVKSFGDDDYGPDIVSDYLCDFIERNKDHPFFAYYPMILPHSPFEPTPDSEEWKHGSPAGEVSNQMRQKWFKDMVSYTDKIVGKLLDKVESLGISEDTIVIFTTDNGTNRAIASGTLNGKRYPGGKGTTRDTATRVPLVVWGPGRITPGKVSESLVDFSDFVPTIAELTGVDPMIEPLDGVSFAPELLGGDPSPREWIYCWYERDGKRDKAVQFVRDRTYKLYHDGRFFNTEEDLQEKNPISMDALTEEQKVVFSKLSKILDEKVEEAKGIVPTRTAEPRGGGPSD